VNFGEGGKKLCGKEVLRFGKPANLFLEKNFERFPKNGVPLFRKRV